MIHFTDILFEPKIIIAAIVTTFVTVSAVSSERARDEARVSIAQEQKIEANKKDEEEGKIRKERIPAAGSIEGKSEVPKGDQSSLRQEYWPSESESLLGSQGLAYPWGLAQRNQIRTRKPYPVLFGGGTYWDYDHFK